MAAKNRPAKCLYYYKGYCLYSKDEPNKQCSGVCSEYVHYDLDKKYKTAALKTFTADGVTDKVED